jgi:hypothetical protein
MINGEIEDSVIGGRGRGRFSKGIRSGIFDVFFF